MIFQDPATNLNPLFTIREQLIDAVLYQCYEANEVPGIWRGILPSARQIRKDAHSRAIELMSLVGISGGDLRIEEYPHQFSGGQRQRIGIARALAVNPEFLVCDESVAALDVSIQAQVINLLIELQQELGLAYVFISHDLSVVRHISDEVMVMYLGKPVEQGPNEAVFNTPQHPYTQALLSATPQADVEGKRQRIKLTGELPSPIDPPSGCAFNPRCQYADKNCQLNEPVMELYGDSRVSCLAIAQQRIGQLKAS